MVNISTNQPLDNYGSNISINMYADIIKPVQVKTPTQFLPKCLDTPGLARDPIPCNLRNKSRKAVTSGDHTPQSEGSTPLSTHLSTTSEKTVNVILNDGM